MGRLILPPDRTWDRANDRRWLTTADVARMLERSRQWIQRLETRGELPCDRTMRGQRLFRRVDVLDYLQRRATLRAGGHAAQLRVLRVRMAKADLDPRQGRLRLGRGERSVGECQPKRVSNGGKCR